MFYTNSTIPPEEAVCDNVYFYAKPGGYIYEITATWDETVDVNYYGTANYYVYIIGGGEHQHTICPQAQTVPDPITGYCGNTQTTVYIDGQAYSFMGSYSVALTDILINLDYQHEKLCNCLPEYTVDTEFCEGYGISLTESYARSATGQADLTQEQVDKITEIIQWAQKNA